MNQILHAAEKTDDAPKSYKFYFISVVVLYTLLVLGGIHTSSIGILGGEGIHDSRTYYGKPQSIRSDEFLRSTPILLGQIKSNELSPSLKKRTTTTPFDSNYSDRLLSGDIAIRHSINLNFHNLYSGTLKADVRVLSLLPLEKEFTARWWLDSLYLFLGMGLLFRALKMSWKYALLCSLLVWLSPPNQWWSLWPLQSLGPASMAVGLFLGALLKMNALVASQNQSKRRYLLDVVLPLVATVFFAVRVPNSYQPWSIPAAVFFLSLTLGAVSYSQISKETLKKIAVPFLGLSALVSIPLIIKLSRSVSRLMNTVYPGSRRFSGFADFPHWSGPAAWGFQNVSGAVVNQSENAIGLIIFIPVAVLVLLLRRKREHTKKSIGRPLALGSAPLLFFLLWVIAPWSKGASAIFLMSRFPPERMMQILGVLSPVVFVFAIAYWRELKDREDRHTNSVAIIGLVVFVLTLQGVVALRQRVLADLSTGSIWLTAAVTTIAISLAFTYKYWRLGLATILVASVFSVINVNPMVQGLGIFGTSSAMSALQSAQDISQGRWASDSYLFDSVPTGGGMRLLSGNQGSGPNLAAYHLLDPNDEHIGIWNRGGSYVFFNWTTGPEIGFVNPAPDIIAIQIDPCNPILNQFDLTWVVSSADQSSHTCLRPYENIMFQGLRFFVYQRL